MASTLETMGSTGLKFKGRIYLVTDERGVFGQRYHDISRPSWWMTTFVDIDISPLLCQIAQHVRLESLLGSICSDRLPRSEVLVPSGGPNMSIWLKLEGPSEDLSKVLLWRKIQPVLWDIQTTAGWLWLVIWALKHFEKCASICMKTPPAGHSSFYAAGNPRTSQVCRWLSSTSDTDEDFQYPTDWSKKSFVSDKRPILRSLPPDARLELRSKVLESQRERKTFRI